MSRTPCINEQQVITNSRARTPPRHTKSKHRCTKLPRREPADKRGREELALLSRCSHLSKKEKQAEDATLLQRRTRPPNGCRARHTSGGLRAPAPDRGTSWVPPSALPAIASLPSRSLPVPSRVRVNLQHFSVLGK